LLAALIVKYSIGMPTVQLSSILRRLSTQRYSLIVMAGFILSRLTGLIRDIVASYYFGTSAEMAAYGAAISTVDLLYLVIIGGALGSSFIPVFIELWEREHPTRAWDLTGAVVTWALIALGIASMVLLPLRPGWYQCCTAVKVSRRQRLI
jgi:Uncharacterized membrane protein, putative virulence factor